MKRTGWICLLRIGLVLFLVLQMNALPIHEYNLRQQGYTLVHPQLVASGTESGSFEISPKKHDFYNIAQCKTHSFLSFHQQCDEVFAGHDLLDAVRISFESDQLKSSLQRNDHFLSVLSSRAPPAFA
jgi:hypothetical protein